MSKIKIEVHLLQNFAPSCLNRDENNEPKTCQFGDVQRARVSSQSFKRATRDSEVSNIVMDSCDGQSLRAVRTRYLITEIAERLSESKPAKKEIDKTVAEVFKKAGLERTAGADETEKDTSKVILFMRESCIGDMLEAFREELTLFQPKSKKETDEEKKETEKVIDRLAKHLAKILEMSSTVPEIALYGRMIEVKDSSYFGSKHLRVDAACQVAHAISTHQVSADFDFFSAVDDLNKNGASMVGISGFNSPCLYRYALLDREQLKKNLHGCGEDDLEELTDRSIRAFLEAMVNAIPTGKQTSYSAQNSPSFAIFTVRDGGVPISLVNAFVKPIKVQDDDSGDLVDRSAAILLTYLVRHRECYGKVGVLSDSIFYLGLGEADELVELVPARRNPARDVHVRQAVSNLVNSSDRGSVNAAIQAVMDSVIAARNEPDAANDNTN